MRSVDLKTTELMEFWIASDPDASRLRGTFPIVGGEGSEDLIMVHFVLEPGNYLASHTDSLDEILIVLAGEVEATIGDERATLSAGGLAIVPGMVPHSVKSTGDEPAKVIGVFAGRKLESTFEEPLLPVGVETLVNPMPVSELILDAV